MSPKGLPLRHLPCSPAHRYSSGKICAAVPLWSERWRWAGQGLPAGDNSLLCPIYRLGAKPHDNTQHAGRRVHIRIPFISAVAVSHSGGAGHKIFLMVRSGYTLYQDSHLFILFFQSPEQPVFQSGIIHGAGINGAHGLLKFCQPLLGASLIYTEHGLVLSAKALPKPSSRKLEERTIKGLWPKYSMTFWNCSRIFPGNSPKESRSFSSLAALKYSSWSAGGYAGASTHWTRYRYKNTSEPI